MPTFKIGEVMGPQGEKKKVMLRLGFLGKGPRLLDVEGVRCRERGVS